MNAMLPLLIFFPFLAAPLSYLIGKRSRDYRNLFAIAATAVALAFSLAGNTRRPRCTVTGQPFASRKAIMSCGVKALSAL